MIETNGYKVGDRVTIIVGENLSAPEDTIGLCGEVSEVFNQDDPTDRHYEVMFDIGDTSWYYNDDELELTDANCRFAKGSCKGANKKPALA